MTSSDVCFGTVLVLVWGMNWIQAQRSISSTCINIGHAIRPWVRALTEGIEWWVYQRRVKLQDLEFVSVWVRDPRIQKEDFWHSYIDYEICIHTNSMCFTMKTSCVRRRYREFVWLRQRLQSNALLVQLPELPSKNLFFNMNNRQHVDQRRQGLEDFLRKVLQNALLLSDSSLHLFLQSHLNSEDIEACVSGQTKYSVEEAIHKFALMNRRFPEEEEGKKENDIDYDSESSSSGFGHSSDDSSSHGCKMSTAPQES
uniref:Sorting nexin 10 n=1 Tax=Bos taurus TaxID=9913 RepID=A0AAA9T6F3_BOVIN